VKYRNEATADAWSGRTLQPKWVRAEIEAGRKIEDFAIWTAQPRLADDLLVAASALAQRTNCTQRSWRVSPESGLMSVACIARTLREGQKPPSAAVSAQYCYKTN
jgi:hypothetical protein